MKKAVAVISLLFLATCNAMQGSDPVGPTTQRFTQTPSVIPNTPTMFTTATITLMPVPTTPGPPTTTPLPSSTPRVNVPLKSGKGIILTSIQMFDSQNGWGFDSDRHILRTRNGGRTWQDVTPPTGHYDRTGFFALDSDSAWATFTIGLYSKPETAYVWRTQDGGETWSSSKEFRLDLDQYGEPYSSEFYLPQAIQFVDRQTGWLLASVSYNMNSTRPLFVQTSDGGQTWKTINSRIGFPGSCIGVGFAFLDSQTGWAGGNCFSRGVVFTPMKSIFANGGWSVGKTIDGGHTFGQRTTMPPPVELRQPEVLEADGNCGEIRFISVAVNVIGIEWACSIFTPLKPDYRYFAITSDRGQTWLSWKATGNEFFLDAKLGWRLFSPGELQQTTDGGLNWATIKIVTWDDAQFDFVNEQEGWAIISGGRAMAFLRTDNGGQTWAELNPIIGP